MATAVYLDGAVGEAALREHLVPLHEQHDLVLLHEVFDNAPALTNTATGAEQEGRRGGRSGADGLVPCSNQTLFSLASFIRSERRRVSFPYSLDSLCLPGHFLHHLRGVRKEVLSVHRCPKSLHMTHKHGKRQQQ